MLYKRKVILATVMLLLAFAVWVSAANRLIDQKSVLSGKVLANHLVVAGTAVREGDILVMVDSITGPVPAVRSTTDGVVREVLVKPGESIRAGEVLVRIESVRK
ncbi:hypothetical protein P22_1582 [Propionispora sp. 2/2-37]|uniref:biotin/lipoyl-containing protein n=1 Tax=Propionispora sp. 2/2-37 TaxID=1677858 RepID=UPI0006BB6419|nr:biotin/lipoyl-containing protein [Propionispora sp. 2/2-37]CUH95511.1 hypothetical protein P22_1582 [Propionispora sp. 2/2-37]